MKRAIVASLLICMVAVVATAGCMEDGSDTEADATMTWGELYNDMNRSQSQSGMRIRLNSVDEGDTLVIKDKIAAINYTTIRGRNVTNINLTSMPSSPISVEGDITGEFDVDDSVKLTTHIINVTYTQQSQYGQMTIDLEWMEEMWDAQNTTFKPFPQSVLEHTEDTDIGDDTDNGDDGEDDTSDSSGMSFSEFWSDYGQSVDNETLTATTYLKSFDDGDTVVIEDQLQNLTYNATNDFTIIQFASLQQRALTVQGDITGEFQAGDSVSLTSEIVNTTFNYQTQGQNWTINYETFADGWDTEKNQQVPFPRDVLQHAD